MYSIALIYLFIIFDKQCNSYIVEFQKLHARKILFIFP